MATEEQQGNTLEADLASAFDQLAVEPAADPSPGASSPAPSPEAAQPSDDAGPAEDAAQAEQPRDEKGRFAPKSGGEPEAPEDAPDDQPAAPKLDTTPKTAQPPIEPPEFMKMGAKVVWNRLPRPIQEELAGLAQKGREGVFAEAIDPYREMFRLKGTDPQVAVTQLLAVWNALEKNPKETLQWLGQQYGVTATAPTSGNAANGSGAQKEPEEDANRYRDPEVEALERKIASYEQVLATHQQKLAEFESRTLQGQRQTAEQALAEFAADPAHPHFSLVRGRMGQLMQSGAAKTLKEAYDQAVYTYPELREIVLAERIAAELAKKAGDGRAKAEKAKQAAVSVTGAPSAGASAPTSALPANLNDQLSQLYDELSRP